MNSLEPREPTEKYLFSDFECTQENVNHKVNLAVTEYFNGTKWRDRYTIEEWVDQLEKGKFGGYTIMCHNGQGYDFQLILKELTRRPSFSAEPVQTGSKILYANVTINKKRFTRKSGIRLVDSLNFQKMPLSNFTKTFDLKTKKGFYPHLFNTNENFSYVGPIPDKSYFCTDQMTSYQYEEFERWYEERKREPWDNAKELTDYCHADVKLLREGCLKFRKTVMEETGGHDPFQENTLASSAMRIFRSRIMVNHTIAALRSIIVKELKQAFCGGRTGATKVYFKASLTQRIRYADFTSLYPWVNKYGFYPLGHPIVYDDDFPDMNEGLSIWKVDITCPQNLYHHLLHYKDPKTGRPYVRFTRQNGSEVH